MNQSDQINQLLKEEKYSDALALLEIQLEKAEVSKAVTLATMAHCHYRLANFSISVALLDNAVALAPQQAQLYSERGVAYFMLGNRNASLQDFNKAQELEPENPYRYSSRAYVKDAFGDTKGAINDYQKAIELDPQDAISYNNLGLLMEKLGYLKEAKKHFTKADELEGRTPQTVPEQNQQTEKSVELADQKPVKETEKKAPTPKEALNVRYLGNTIKSIFTTRKGFQEFVQYWLGKRP